MAMRCCSPPLSLSGEGAGAISQAHLFQKRQSARFDRLIARTSPTRWAE